MVEKTEEPSPPVFGEPFGQEWNWNTKFVLYVVCVKDMSDLKLLHNNTKAFRNNKFAFEWLKNPIKFQKELNER